MNAAELVGPARWSSALLSLLLLLLCAFAGSAGAAGDGGGSGVQGAQAFAFVNEQRAANGIPAFTALMQQFSTAWCPDEDHGPSGGESWRDWSGGILWTADASPWSRAPLHQESLYDPAFSSFGDSIAPLNGSPSSCAGVGDYVLQWTEPTFFAFTSELGPAHTPPSETVSGEGPFAPQQKVGIALGVPTGPDLIVYAEGFAGEDSWAHQPVVSSAAIIGPDGQVPDVRIADYRNLDGYDDPGAAFLIPRSPLVPGTTYQATANWQGPQGDTATQIFSFTTTGRRPKPYGTISGLQLSASSISFTFTPVVGTSAPVQVRVEKQVTGHLVIQRRFPPRLCRPGTASAKEVRTHPWERIRCSTWQTAAAGGIEASAGLQSIPFSALKSRLTGAGAYRVVVSSGLSHATAEINLP